MTDNDGTAGRRGAFGRWADITIEALAGLLGRLGRTWLSIAGMAIGVAALVATIGIAQSAGRQIVSRLDTLEGTLVRVVDNAVSDEGSGLNWSSERAVRRIQGVTGVGSRVLVSEGVTVDRLDLPGSRTAVRLDTFVVSHGLLETVEGNLAVGRFFDPYLDGAAYPAAVLGPGAAGLLGLEYLHAGRDAIFIEGVPFVVIGVLADVGDEPSLFSSVLVSRGWFGEAAPQPEEMIVRTERGASQIVSSQLARVVDPNQPDSVTVVAPADAGELRETIASDVNSLFLTLGAVAVVVATIGIANIALVSVIQRRSEIGLRRAVGATRTRIGAEFMTESTMLGMLGGILGSSTGVMVITVSAAQQGWVPIVDPRVIGLGVAIGASAGLLAGLYPALRAANLEPTSALRAR